MWNYYGETRGRTNNYAKCFHLKRNRAINRQTISFARRVSTIKKTLIENQAELRRLLRGGLPKKRKRIYV